MQIWVCFERMEKHGKIMLIRTAWTTAHELQRLTAHSKEFNFSFCMTPGMGQEITLKPFGVKFGIICQATDLRIDFFSRTFRSVCLVLFIHWTIL